MCNLTYLYTHLIKLMKHVDAEITEIAKLIDHTNLSQICTTDDIDRICEEAIKYGFAAVCIPPFFVQHAARVLENEPTKVATVIGFPMGYSHTPAKVAEIQRAIVEGADEIDVVINLCAVKSGNWAYVENDITSIATAAHIRGKTIKIIFETGLLTKDEIKKICEMCNKSEVNFAKTSTGFSENGASPEIIAFLRAHLDDSIKIKASGGIRDLKTARNLIESGADRLGCSTSINWL